MKIIQYVVNFSSIFYAWKSYQLW